MTFLGLFWEGGRLAMTRKPGDLPAGHHPFRVRGERENGYIRSGDLT